MRHWDSCRTGGRAVVDGKFLQIDGHRFVVRGVSYGTFAPDGDGTQFPDGRTISRDFGAMRAAGINTVRLYTPPPQRLLDVTSANDLRLMIGLPWAQHVAFLDDRHMRREIRAQIVAQVRAHAGHPATLLFALGNEIPPSVVRWHGHRAVERFLRDLYDEAKSAAPEALFTYVSYPPTEYLDTSVFDVCAFNVYLHEESRLRAYLARMQHIAGHKPLLIAEAGADSLRHGEDGQAELAAMQIGTALAEGACGVVAFAWTDEWWRGGAAVDDWAFGLVDAARRPKPALDAVSRAFLEPRDRTSAPPSVSVIVCAYNAEATIDECLSSLAALAYRSFEVIVVNDGSTDGTADRLRRHPFARAIHVPRGGLSNARNIGLAAASGAIVAYCDADVRVDPQWLDFLVRPFSDPAVTGSGGPNVVPPDDPWIAQCVARAPGAPTHVLFTDETAEHVPGCNMAFRRDALLAIGGFNPVFVRAGDDVDLCWRLQAQGGRIGFAPAALVWHRHRASIRAYWRQQAGYGEGEAWLGPLHPDKFAGRHILWRGLVYSPLPFVRSLFDRRINCGVWGSAAFPSVYRVGAPTLTYMPHSARWLLGSILLLLAGALLLPWQGPAAAALLGAGLMGCGVTAWKCVSHACASEIRSLEPVPGLPRRLSGVVYRLVIACLHFIQPLARLHGRIRGLLHRPVFAAPIEERGADGLHGVSMRRIWEALRLMAGRAIELRFWSESWTNNSDLLSGVVSRLRASRVANRIEVDDGWWTDRDVSIAVGALARLDLQSLVEDHGAGRCLFRANVRLRARWLPVFAAVMLTAAVYGAWIEGHPLGSLTLLPAALLLTVIGALAVQVSEGTSVLRDTIRLVAAQFAMQAMAARPRERTGAALLSVRHFGRVVPRRRRLRKARSISVAVGPRPLAAQSELQEHR